ncbi:asparagine synthase (glutamine-hydrolyzing) [Halobacillus yeomjeoni]|uniref:asparagine synthase (glutamine-hydrolyzing) n=1 Tax=Halobacillus yeomjeoni TaxID=311194 RepID=A0A931HVY3_9BACI|nr:asparagine synthase (glutamine-hydrolyzing) [Halobacillus yeomjeoni]MBH0230483.1 asparagine synthase (glutamine-hydrolyzing) [Halobacillus yeomjeoni]
MCGIVGYVNENQVMEESVIQAMMERIHHRGPDDGDSYTDGTASLGFRRLSIIDMSSSANQPMMNEDGRFILTFNGEIYNFHSLKDDLISKGHQFKSHTDSEVILHGYEEYGVEILQQLRGMFAFAIWDKQEKELFLARDPFGIKPLYYTESTKDGSFIYGSEIKSFFPYPLFIKRFNDEALAPYLTFQYSALDQTFFKGVHKLKPGHYMIYKKGQIETHEYWNPEFTETQDKLSDAIDSINEVMNDSVQYHKISDVKVGSFLSGGIDSSYITTLLKPENTFSVGFKEYEGIFNETNLAEDLSHQLGIQNHKKLITGDEFFKKIPEIQYHMDEPHANLSSVPLYFLAELAKEHVTVVLSGEGADELFGGYEWYRISEKQKIYETIPFPVRRVISKVGQRLPQNKITNFLVKGGQKIEEKFVGQAKVFTTEDAQNVLKKPYRNQHTPQQILAPTYKRVGKSNDSTKMQYADIKHWLPGDILQKADKMSSAHSLELRVPFLDKEVMKVAGTLAPSLRANNKDTKFALRQAARTVLPDEWANRPKVGFPVPIRDWLRQDKYYNHVKQVFDSDHAAQFFQTQELLRYLNEHYENKGNHHRYIWTVFVFLTWYEIYFIHDGEFPHSTGSLVEDRELVYS